MEGFDLNSLRAKALEGGEEKKLPQKEGKRKVSERISELEERITAGLSEEERAHFEEENDTTPEVFLEKLKMLDFLRENKKEIRGEGAE